MRHGSGCDVVYRSTGKRLNGRVCNSGTFSGARDASGAPYGGRFFAPTDEPAIFDAVWAGVGGEK